MSLSVVIRAAGAPDMSAMARLAAKLVRFHHALDAQRFLCEEPIAPGYERWLTGEHSNPSAVLVGAEQREDDATPPIVGYA
jgi:hypothetical protein